MESPKLEEFLTGPLVTWFISCLKDPNSVATYEDLVDGVLLHSVLLQIDPEVFHSEITEPNNDETLRIKNLEIIVKNLKQFYEKKLGHLLVKLPDVKNLGKEPKAHVEEMKLLLLLILGCAIQCEKNEQFVLSITNFDETTQHAIVDYLKQITTNQEFVITPESLQSTQSDNLFNLLKTIIDERNDYYEKVKALESKVEFQNSTMEVLKNENFYKSKFNTSMELDNKEEPCCHDAADFQSKMRKLRQELKEKSESLKEFQSENEHNTMLIVQLQEENEKLMMETRIAKSYRDELDAAIEKAEKANRLEIENARYREKLNSMDYFKTRIEELLVDNKVLLETKESLEDELTSYKDQSDKIRQLEAEISEWKQILTNMSLEKTEEREKYEHFQENIHLQYMMNNTNETSFMEQLNDSEDTGFLNNAMSENSNTAETEVLKCKLEIQRLSTIIKSLKKNCPQENASRIEELEKDKKEIAENYENLIYKNSSVELNYKLAQQENRFLQASLVKQREEIEDLISLESQHDQLSSDYLKLLQDRDTLKTNLTEAQKEAQTLKDSYKELEIKYNTIQNDQETLKRKIKCLTNLRDEHSKLKEDFKIIFTQSQILTAERKSLFEKKSIEINKLKQKLSEMEIQFHKKEERCYNLESQVQILNNRIKDLLQANSELESTKEKLLEHSHNLALQCKEVLEQTLEEKDNIYTERKTFTDTINQMDSQKRKLEDKIFEFYKNAPSSTNNKGKGITSNFVKKVKKASSSLFSKNRIVSSSWEIDEKQKERQENEFEFKNSTFQKSKTMTLDRRLSGKRGARDRFSFGTFTRGRMSDFSESLNKSFSETRIDSKADLSEEQKSIPKLSIKCSPARKSVFEVIKEIEDAKSLQNTDLEENNLENDERKSVSNLRWIEYGCT